MNLKAHYLEFAAIIAGITLTSVAQTNSLPANTQWLALSEPHLQIEYKPAKLALPEVHLQETNSDSSPVKSLATEHQVQHSDSLALNTSYTDAGFSFGHSGLGLIQPPAPLPHDSLSRACEAVFKPEVVHIGQKATFSCSIWTAIKRRDPLCLLNVNPSFLKITW
jgi:hypothetical protein